MSLNKLLGFLILFLIFCPLNPWAMDKENKFQFIFIYNGNQLDTFHGTFTKNMYRDPPVTINLSLSRDELDQIEHEMIEIGFFKYPREITVSHAKKMYMMTNPPQSYYFKVKSAYGAKELSWKFGVMDPQDPKVINLQKLISLIEGIIYSKPEVKNLPFPKSGIPM